MKNIVTPLIYKQQQYPEYGVCKKTGKIHSCKQGSWRPRAEKVSGGSPYPNIVLSLNSKHKKTISVHVAVHETLNPELPRLPGVTESQWRRTPKSVKLHVRELYQVNHIDHNPLNFAPHNLEWTTAMQNVQKYQEFRKKAHA